jgi:hypothetical protein
MSLGAPGMRNLRNMRIHLASGERLSSFFVKVRQSPGKISN